MKDAVLNEAIAYTRKQIAKDCAQSREDARAALAVVEGGIDESHHQEQLPMDIAQKIIDARNSCDLTESDLLAPVLHPIDVGADWIQRGSYLTYWAVGAVLQPTSLIEIGSRYGYSIQAINRGSGRLNRVFSIDSEYDFPGSCDYVKSKFFRATVLKADTATLKEMHPITRQKYDLAHVDGEHTADGCYRDCNLCWQVLRKGGFLLIDDITSAPDRVKAGADRFCKEKGLTPAFIDCYRGMYLIEKAERAAE